MPNYLLTYHGEMSMPSDPAETEQVMAAWGEWYGQIGEQLVDGGAPFAVHKAIDANGDVDAPAALTGYTVVTAADFDEATTIAKGCPVLGTGNTVQISESMDMG